LFQDGVPVAQSALLGSCMRTYDNGLPLVVASDFHGFARFRGHVDELRLSSIARYTGDFSATVFQMPGLTFPNDESSTLALYHFDEESNVPAADSSIENNPASLVTYGTNVAFDTRCF
jgi:hypothetical protein